jgi:hypothetical protein
MATILTIIFRILPNFELKLEIPNIMLVSQQTRATQSVAYPLA